MEQTGHADHLDIGSRQCEPGSGPCSEISDALRVTEGIGAFRIRDFPEQPRDVLDSRCGHVQVREGLFTEDCIPH